ncbi:MAG: hypothetical protein K8R48_08810 [Alphaproteobacteria bacterium]|nr:hypothetical protein [Alphaproteobacteria bacterium]
MRYSHFAILSTLSILAVLTATPAAHAFSPADLHQGPETAAVPVPDVEKTPLPAPEGMQEAASAPPQQVFTPETPVITVASPNQDSSDQQEAQSRQNKVLKAALQAKEQELRSEKTASLKDNNKPAASLAAIEPAAGGKEFVSVSMAVNPPSPAPESPKLSHVNEFVDKIMAYHLPESTKVNPAAAVASQVTLEDLLSGAGVALNSFVPAETVATGVVAQWASGKISGLYERVAGNDDFNSQVISYTGRYRQNCGTGLTVHVSPAKTSKAGTTATVDIECAMPSNSYAVSFLFLEDDNGFSTILHTAALAEKEKLRGIRDAIAQKLNGSQGFAAPQAIRQSASTAPLKLNIPAAGTAPASGAAAMDDLATIIIQ